MPESTGSVQGISPAAASPATEDSAVGEVSHSAVGDKERGLKSWAELLKGDSNETAETCEDYLSKLVVSVEERLLKLLQGSPAVGGVALVGSLHQQAPLTMDDGGSLQTTKEHWRWDNCRKSLESKGIYQAPGTIFWVSKAPPTWEGSDIPGSTITYGMMAGGRLVWSDEKFLRSSDDPAKRRYSIRFALPHQPIIGSLLVGVFARLLDCCLVRWFAG